MQTRVCRLHAQGDIRIETETLADPGPGEVIVAMGAGGICGSDLHYYQHGGFGAIRVREPIILGHEAAGTVAALGAGVTSLTEGQKIAINPSRPCGTCRYCTEGLTTHCLNMRFSGSAMRVPHEQGLFRDRMIVEAAQCVPVANTTDISEAACAEPLAVCLHAGQMAGELAGKRVLVTGSGPIGALCAAVARHHGAIEVVVTDLQDIPLQVARAMGATQTVNVLTESETLEPFKADKGHFDVVFECSAAAPAVATAIACARPQGRIVQVGVTGELPFPIQPLVGKELTFQGTQRFRHSEFDAAVAAIASRTIDVRPLITGRFALEYAHEAFETAGDRTRSSKVHLTFA